MAYSRGGGVLSQYSGFPALIFLALKDSATRQHGIHERLDTLVHLYAYLRATLPEKKEVEGIECKEGEEPLQVVMDGINLAINAARQAYNPKFEETATYSDEENKFLQDLDMILYKVTEVIARTKIIDNQRLDTFEAPAGTT